MTTTSADPNGSFSTSPTDLTVADINLGSIDTFMRPDLPGIFEKLRNERPVSWHQHPDSGTLGFWAVVRYDDIVAVNRDAATFTSTQGIQVRIEHDQPRGGKGSMIEMDGAQHMRFRRLLGPLFMPSSVAKLESRIRARVAETLDALAGKASFDFVADYATPIPQRFFYDFIGVPKKDQDRILALADLLFFSSDPRHGGQQERMQQAGIELQAYGRELALAKRAHPAEDFFSWMANVEVDGDRLTIDELGSMFGLVGGAGADTTRATLGHAMTALSRFEDQKRWWLEDLDGRAATAVDELVVDDRPELTRRDHSILTHLQDYPRVAGCVDKCSYWGSV